MHHLFSHYNQINLSTVCTWRPGWALRCCSHWSCLLRSQYHEGGQRVEVLLWWTSGNQQTTVIVSDLQCGGLSLLRSVGALLGLPVVSVCVVLTSRRQTCNFWEPHLVYVISGVGGDSSRFWKYYCRSLFLLIGCVAGVRQEGFLRRVGEDFFLEMEVICSSFSMKNSSFRFPRVIWLSFISGIPQDRFNCDWNQMRRGNGDTDLSNLLLYFHILKL